MRSPSPKRFALRAVTLALSGLLSSLAFVAAPVSAEPEHAATQAKDVTIQSAATRFMAGTFALPIRANMIGLTYRGSGAEIEMRIHRPGQGWGPWEEIDSSDIAPDRWTGEGNDRSATEPVWAGTADSVMVRMKGETGNVRDVRLHAINTLGDAEPKTWWKRLFAFLGSAPASLAPRTQAAEAVPAVPEIVSRAQWGADERWRRCCPRYAPTVEVMMIHHTVNPNNYSWDEAPAMLRAIYRYHRFNLDYDDIAYNFIVDRFGRIFEGRFGGVTKPVVGAHTEGMNTKTSGIALLGTFSNAYPSGPMMVSLMRFLAWKLDVHHIPGWGHVPMTSGGSKKFARGQTVNMNRISGHRDAQVTDCPGTRMYYQLPRIRETIMPWGAPKFYMNSTPRELRADGDDKDEGPIDVKVWNSSELNWKIDFADAAGVAKASFSGKGTFAQATWDGKDQVSGALARSGVGTITVDAWDDNNKHATKAEIPMRIVNKHPNGTVLRSGTTRVFIDDAGASRSIPSDTVYASWFGPNEIVSTGPAEIPRYTAGLPLGFRDGTLAKTPDGAYHFINNGQRRAFASPAVFQTLGFRDEAAIQVSHADVNALPSGPVIEDATRHPAGSVVEDADKVAWVVRDGTKHRIPNSAVGRSWYRDAEVVPALPGDTALPEGEQIQFRSGTLLRTPSQHVWIVSNGTRLVFFDEELFAFMGYSTKAIRTVTWGEIGVLPYGGTVSGNV
ncbi:MAG TPA: N-acetylmuramoyl-L-alanine amidase [Actinomycetota bacterium]|nr:N-acetylmuramoyl-L-alanine amidase [Actinomycetota bacterium]